MGDQVTPCSRKQYSFKIETVVNSIKCHHRVKFHED